MRRRLEGGHPWLLTKRMGLGGTDDDEDWVLERATAGAAGSEEASRSAGLGDWFSRVVAMI